MRTLGRGIYSMNQCQYLLEMIQKVMLMIGDIVYLQDYWDIYKV